MGESKINTLILTSSGGGGHLQAAIAKEHELMASGKHTIIKKDVFLDYLGKLFGHLFASLWNNCQSHGRTNILYFFCKCTRGVDIFISPIFMVNFLYEILRHDIDHVIDTQFQGTKVFLKSIRIASKIKGKKITYEKVLTDMPTKKCFHFFKAFRNLSRQDIKALKVVTTKPQLEKGQTEESFWKEVAGLPLETISYEKFPLRPGFEKFKNARKPLNLEFNTVAPGDTHLISKCISFGNTPFRRGKNKISFTFDEEILSVITLGSFPQKSLIISYMRKFIQQKKTHCFERKDVLFLLVGPQKTAISFYESIIEELQNTKDYPENLTIIPLSFQDDTALAPLYYNLDFIISKSGGLTTMELIKSVEKNIFIHDIPTTNASNIFSFLSRTPFDSMPPWERGNADYIIAAKDGALINPDSFCIVTKAFFEKEFNFALTSAQ